jgi:DNA-damage-inducible protein J
VLSTPDPFFSQANMAYMKKSVQELKAGKGTTHELIVVDDE